MAHDFNGTLLSIGDTVVIPCVVKNIQGDENFCSLTVETEFVMPGNGAKNTISAISTKQVILVKKSV